MARSPTFAIWLVWLSAVPACAQGVITTVADSGRVLRGDGGPATIHLLN